MAAVKRRINSTGRRRIGHEHVTVSLAPAIPGVPQAASAELKLDGLSFPPTAAVVIEAYQRSAGMRFDCGTFADPVIPEKLILDDLDPANPVLFRLKVVDQGENPGRLLGSAERIRASGDEAPDARTSLFPIRKLELNGEIWKVKIDESGPWLLLNYNIPGITALIQKNSLVTGILLPAALRIVLDQIASDPAEEDGEEASWKSRWLKYLREDLNYPDEPSDLSNEEDRASWVDGGVRAFCTSNGFVAAIRTSLETPHEIAA